MTKNVVNRIDRDVLIRRVTYEDVDELIKICRMSFPDSLRWQGPSFYARKWWNITLGLPSCETWVSLSDGQAVGFLILVTDGGRYKKARRKLRPGLLFVLAAMGTCPKLFLKKLLCRIFMAISTRARDSFAEDIDVSPCTRIELVAVLPHMQNKGLGTKMLEFSIKRSSELRRKGITLLVNSSNISAIRVYEKVAFKKTGQSKRGLTYTKVISETP